MHFASCVQEDHAVNRQEELPTREVFHRQNNPIQVLDQQVENKPSLLHTLSKILKKRHNLQVGRRRKLLLHHPIREHKSVNPIKKPHQNELRLILRLELLQKGSSP